MGVVRSGMRLTFIRLNLSAELTGEVLNAMIKLLGRVDREGDLEGSLLRVQGCGDPFTNEVQRLVESDGAVRRGKTPLRRYVMLPNASTTPVTYRRKTTEIPPSSQSSLLTSGTCLS